ncbi:MAG: aminomethyl transferase family protein [Desulfobacterales bacterium]|jgi:aminomethyltransferase
MAPLATPLHGWHVLHKARMAAFGGFEMPLWYGSAKDEHRAVLTRAGVFDTSHMAALLVSGSGAFDLLQFCFTNDLSACLGPRKAPLKPGRAVYGAFLNAEGHVIDDAIVFMLAGDTFLVVLNAGMGHAVVTHLGRHAEDFPAQLSDLSGRFGKLDVQGPLAAKIMRKVLADPYAVFETMPYFAFKGGFGEKMPILEPVMTRDGIPLLLSRTGYTGELGFEVFSARPTIAAVWEAVMAAGAEYGLTACGLAARDSLRAGAGLPLSHQDIGAWPFCRHPWPFALPYNAQGEGFRKTFLGHDALRPCSAPYTYPFIGSDPRKVSLPARVLNDTGRVIGDVLTCVSDMGIGWHDEHVFSIGSPDAPQGFKGGGLCCGFLRVSDALPPGTPLTLRDHRRRVGVRIVKEIRPDRTARRAIHTML